MDHILLKLWKWNWSFPWGCEAPQKCVHPKHESKKVFFNPCASGEIVISETVQGNLFPSQQNHQVTHELLNNLRQKCTSLSVWAYVIYSLRVNTAIALLVSLREARWVRFSNPHLSIFKADGSQAKTRWQLLDSHTLSFTHTSFENLLVTWQLHYSVVFIKNIFSKCWSSI